MSILSKRVAALEASLAPSPSPYVIATYCRGDDGFDAALAEITEEDRGKPGAITDQDEVFSVSVIKGLEGQDEDFTITAPSSIRSRSQHHRQGACLKGLNQRSGVTGSEGQQMAVQCGSIAQRTSLATATSTLATAKPGGAKRTAVKARDLIMTGHPTPTSHACGARFPDIVARRS